MLECPLQSVPAKCCDRGRFALNIPALQNRMEEGPAGFTPAQFDHERQWAGGPGAMYETDGPAAGKKKQLGRRKSRALSKNTVTLFGK